MDFFKHMNYNLTKLTKFFRIKRQLNMVIFVGIFGFSTSIFFNILIYRKMSRILRIIDKTDKIDETDKSK